MTILHDKRLLVTGVVTTESIAWATARAAIDHGAEVVLSALGRDLERAVGAAGELSAEAPLIEADLTDPASVAGLVAAIGDRWGTLDGAVHAVAFAPQEALAGDFVGVGADAAGRAFLTSTHTYAVLAAAVSELAPDHGASIVGLDFDATGAWPVYNWMGVCKAGLEAASRYVARDLGPRGIRSNLVAAGPIRTRAASGIPAFEELTAMWAARAPMAWDPTDADPVADAVCFLLSDLARMISGEIVHVDAGYHAMA